MKKVVRKLRKSNKDMTTFNDLQALHDLPETVLIKDIEVRWNSTYEMLERFLPKRPAIEAFIEQIDQGKKSYPSFTDADWTLISAIVDTLEPVAKQYELLQKRSTSIAYVYPVYKLILSKLARSQAEVLQNKIKSALEKRMKQCMPHFIIMTT